jgi:hypothetical protein
LFNNCKHPRHCYKCLDRNYLIKCQCNPNCQEVITKWSNDNKLRKCKKGHIFNGVSHYNYKGYIQKDTHGYKNVFNPEFKNRIRKDSRMKLHRVIYENHYKCCLLPYIIVHHIDGNKDNNNIENLQPLTKSQHITIHNMGNKHGMKDMTDRKCTLCKTNQTYKRQWFKIQNRYLCKKCGYKKKGYGSYRLKKAE